MHATRSNSTSPVRSSASSEVAERALDVLSCFIDAEGDLGVSEIARRVGIDKSGVHRFLMAMRRKGYVVDNPRTRRYSLGFRALELGHALARQLDLERLANPLLCELRDRVGETTGVATCEDCRRVHLFQVDSRHEIRLTFQLRTPLPLHLGAAGKTLLAFRPEGEREVCLAGSLAAGPPRPETALAELRSDLGRIRERGFATSAGERVPGSRSIAAPVWTWRGDLLALVTSGPADRFTEAAATEAIPVLLEIARQLTRQLGGAEYETESNGRGEP
jgi:IclR family acetate operon transcriptional repressor